MGISYHRDFPPDVPQNSDVTQCNSLVVADPALLLLLRPRASEGTHAKASKRGLCAASAFQGMSCASQKAAMRRILEI